MIYLTLLCALALSGIAAYYSVIGLAAIFTGAFWPIVFMGSVLEASKLVTASWLYRNWKKCPILLKTYLTFSVVILMLITSMGIFGFLSKAHIDSTLDAGANTVEIKTLNMQEKIAKERLDYLLARAKDPSTASNRLDKQIQDTQKDLNEITKKKLPLLKESNKLVAEVGPIKYIGDMVYGTDDDTAIDKAVRLVIMLIMVVFDPLAVLLLIAANMSLKEKNENRQTTIYSPISSDTEHGNKTVQDTEKPKGNSVQIPKENIATVEENVESEEQIVIDEASGESIPPIGKSKSKRGFPNRKSKAVKPNYDYDAEFAFKEKDK
jgi:predicted Holliday junction resolvase-like endonuclease